MARSVVPRRHAEASPSDAKAPTPLGTDEPKKVAVIVVHGVADQKPGETADAVVRMLMASSPDDVTFEDVAVSDEVLRVSSMPATLPVASLDEPVDRARESAMAVGGDIGGATPTSAERSSGKALLQSLASDFQRSGHRPDPGGLVRAVISLRRRPDGKTAAPSDRDDGAARRSHDVDRGLQFTQYLLRKSNRNAALHDDYAMQVTTLSRRRGGAATHLVDVHEMYWADLSRLSGAIPRIITELFTLIFRLSRLGRETVDEASRSSVDDRGPRRVRWFWLAPLQIALDWWFVNGLALLFAQLLLLGLGLVALGLADRYAVIVRCVGVALVAVGTGISAYLRIAPRSRDERLRGALFIAAAFGTALVALPPNAAMWCFGLVVLSGLTVVYFHGLYVAADRFPFVQTAGMSLWGAGLFVAICATVLSIARMHHARPVAHLVQAVLTSVEWTLAMMKVTWIAVAIVCVLWFIASVPAASSRDFEGRASSATGRLGLLASVTIFLVVAMAAWAALSQALGLAVDDFLYVPTFWSDDGRVVQAHSFLDRRYAGSTTTFVAIGGLAVALAFYAAAIFTPSVLAELGIMKATADDRSTQTYRLGRWLTLGYRALDSVVLCITVFAVVLVIGVAVAFFAPASSTASDVLWRVESLLGPLSANALGVLIVSATTSVAALSAFGGLLSRYLPGVRGPLDVALDVDNFLREFPRKAIPRARIFARYRSILARVRDRGYDRIVIVSHSQGTVISAELLRFLSSGDGGVIKDAHRRDRLEALTGCPVRLLTVGCPLRQLYAARFPTLYRWIVDSDGRVVGPSADDLGVATWVNAYTSGDYVGRWLWSGGARHPRLLHPMIDEVAEPGWLGRHHAYDAFDPTPPLATAINSRREVETCIGFGAHTHYFDEDQADVASLLDRLIATDDGLSEDALPITSSIAVAATPLADVSEPPARRDKPVATEWA